MRKRIPFLLFLIVWLFASVPFVLAKSQGGPNGHNADVFNVFGYSRLNSDAQSLLQQIAQEFAKYIDDANVSYAGKEAVEKLLDKIKKIAPDFKTSYPESNGRRHNLTHRVFFHVGFNKDVRKSPGLVKCVEACTTDQKTREEIYEVVQREQATRNKKMTQCVEEAISRHSPNGRVNLSRDQINAIATIVYDVHILGDYIECNGTEEALPKIDVIVGDLINALAQNKGGLGCPNKELKSKFRSAINTAKDIAPIDTGENGSAGNVLSTLISYVPKIIEETPDVRKAIWLE